MCSLSLSPFRVRKKRRRASSARPFAGQRFNSRCPGRPTVAMNPSSTSRHRNMAVCLQLATGAVLIVVQFNASAAKNRATSGKKWKKVAERVRSGKEESGERRQRGGVCLRVYPVHARSSGTRVPAWLSRGGWFVTRPIGFTSAARPGKCLPFARLEFNAGELRVATAATRAQVTIDWLI